MKVAAERARTAAARPPGSRPAAFFQPVQTRLAVNTPGDRHEREAEATAERVMRMPQGEARLALTGADARPGLQLSGAGPGDGAVLPDGLDSAIRGRLPGGQALDPQVRGFMESRFGADFGAVRVHHDVQAARLSGRLCARAFTTGSHIFFGAGQYSPGTSEGRRLLAHELTHTIQQGASVQTSPRLGFASGAPAVQRWGVGDVLDSFAEKANLVPGFRMLTIVLGFNPVNLASVERSAANILRALIELLPLGSLVTGVLERYGVFERAGAWIEEELETLGDIGGQIRAGIDAFLDSLSWTDVFHLGSVWERAKAIFTRPITRLVDFGKGLLVGLLELVRQAILRPLAGLLRSTRGYDLLCAILAQDPLTADPVPRTAEALIGGFMKLIGREEVWENIRKGNAIGRAWQWFEKALAGLIGLVLSVPARVMDTLRSITWQDVVSLGGVLSKVLGLFTALAGSFFQWATGTVLELLEILFSVVAPGLMPYLAKARGAFRSILENPIGFVGNLVRAGRLGFERFAHNIVEHLKTGLIRWLTGPLGEAGVYVPQSFGLLEVLKLVFSVLGLTWQNLRTKLLRLIPEPVLAVLEKSAAILVTLVQDGPAAAWAEIKTEIGELKSMLIEQVTGLVTGEIVKVAVTRIVGMLNPAGAVIQAILAIWNTLAFFVERISQLAATAAAFVDSIAAIAAGQLAGAAQRVEQSLAHTLALAISFLARFVGLGGVPQKLVAIVRRIRQPIDKGLERLVDWLGALLKRLGQAARGAASALRRWWTKQVPVTGGDEAHTLTFEGEGPSAQLVLKSQPTRPEQFLVAVADKQAIPEKTRKEPIRSAGVQANAIAATQQELEKYDAADRPTPAGRSSGSADALSSRLDRQLATLATHIGKTLEGWNATDALVGAIQVPRKSFTYEMKSRLAEAQPDESQLRADSRGRMVNLQRGLARRHIVSSYDMSVHYESFLKPRKISEAKLLLEERGSAPQSRTPVESATKTGIEAAANKRHEGFFGYTRNLFIGDSAENSSIQEELDRGKPGMGEKKLLEHVSHIKRTWALDSSITISGLDAT